MITAGQMLDKIAQVTGTQSSRQTQIEEKHNIKKEAVPITDKRLRHNSGKSDGFLEFVSDIEKRTFFSRFGSSTSSDTLVTNDISMSPLPTTMATSRKVFSKWSTSTGVIISPVTGLFQNKVDVGQPMRSILKKSSLTINPSTRPVSKPCAVVVTLNNKTFHDSLSYAEYEHGPNNIMKSSISHLKRKIKSEPEDVDLKQHFKKSRSESGPVLYDTLFQSYSTMSVKKIKRSLKKSRIESSAVQNLNYKKMNIDPKNN